MRPYELTVVFHPDLEIDLDAPVAKIEQAVEAAGGKVVKRDNWGKRRLAYRIRRQDFGVYVLLEILMDPAKVRGFEKNLLITEEVIRHLLVSRPEPKAPKEKITKKVKAVAKEVAAAESEKIDG